MFLKIKTGILLGGLCCFLSACQPKPPQSSEGPLVFKPAIQSQPTVVQQSPLQQTLISPVVQPSAPGVVGARLAHAGNRLITLTGKTLYTFDLDQPNSPQCYDACAQQWPPYLATPEATAGPQAQLITRRDGTRQWAVKGKPLYTYIGDTQIGDKNGDGVDGTWRIAPYPP